MTVTYANWGGKVKLSWFPGTDLPERKLITSVHGFCFYNKQLLMVDLDDRGWDFPGGHIENGETPEECFKREAMEEGYVEGDCALLGVIEVNHFENENWSETSPYPKVGYQVFYRMDIKKLHPFKGEHEASRRTFIDVKKFAHYFQGWNEIHQSILEEAIKNRSFS